MDIVSNNAILAWIILFFGGIVAGLYASTVGGGALLGFPLLIFAGLPTHAAIATQRLSAVILELVSSLRFHKEKVLNLKLAFILGLFASAGAIIGSKLVLEIDEKILNIIVSILFVGSFLILFNKDKFKIKEKNLTHKNFVLAALSIFLIAVYGGFFGAGFGFFSIVVLVLLGFSFIKSAAMARVIGFFMSLASTIVFAQNNVINYPFALSLGIGYAIGSWIGIGIAIKRGENYIKSLLVIITILTLFRLLGGFFGFKF